MDDFDTALERRIDREVHAHEREGNDGVVVHPARRVVTNGPARPRRGLERLQLAEEDVERRVDDPSLLDERRESLDHLRFRRRRELNAANRHALRAGFGEAKEGLARPLLLGAGDEFTGGVQSVPRTQLRRDPHLSGHPAK